MMNAAVPTAPRIADAAWLRGVPKCRREGRMVYVTLTLASDAFTVPASIAWSAGGLHASTPGISGPVVVCCIPFGVFEHRAPVKLELLQASESNLPILAWTQFPVLAETLFQAELDGGLPVLHPVRAGGGAVSGLSSRRQMRPKSAWTD